MLNEVWLLLIEYSKKQTSFCLFQSVLFACSAASNLFLELTTSCFIKIKTKQNSVTKVNTFYQYTQPHNLLLKEKGGAGVVEKRGGVELSLC